jgi:crotonobetainyl-CoA:carnitine CoA-transferase CaiB-like acyl-CoA transferase
MRLNLKSDEGRRLFYRHVRDADVVLEEFRPDVKKRLRSTIPRSRRPTRGSSTAR